MEPESSSNFRFMTRSSRRIGVSVCGRIASGKSLLLNHLSERLGWRVISFGKYVRDLALSRGLLGAREECQSLGSELFAELGPIKFLEILIETQGDGEENHLIDGVRHISVAQAMNTLYCSSVVIFLDVPIDVRYERYISRCKPGDSVPDYEAFLRLDQAPIELGIDSLAEMADLCLDGTRDLAEILGTVLREIRGRNASS